MTLIPVFIALIVLVLLWYLLHPRRRDSPFHPESLPPPEPETLSSGRLLFRAFLVLSLALVLRLAFEYYPHAVDLGSMAETLHQMKRLIMPKQKGESVVASHTGAVADATGELNLPPSSHTVYPFLSFEAMAAYDEGRFPQAIARFRRLYQAEPRNGWAEYLLAWSYWRAGQAVSANRHLSHACRLGYAEACKLARQTCRLKEPGACGDLSPLPPEPAPDPDGQKTSASVFLTFTRRRLPVPDGTPVRISLYRGDALEHFTAHLAEGRVTLKPLPAATYRLDLHVDRDGDERPTPGDWYFQNRVVLKGLRSLLLLEPAQILRLRIPVDSGRPLSGKEGEASVAVSYPVEFAWEGLDLPGIRYDYAVVQVRPPFQYERVVAEGDTRETRILLPLSPPPSQAFYVFILTARQGSEIVGLLATHGYGWYQWGLPFH